MPEASHGAYLLRRRSGHLGEERCPRNLHLRADRKLLYNLARNSIALSEDINRVIHMFYA
jgi:hypothetical protein